jgi:hypothetical protein
MGQGCSSFHSQFPKLDQALGCLDHDRLTVHPWRWKLQTGAGVDLTPSMHWPAPVVTHEVEADRGPVLVTIEYRIDPRDREPFLAALEKLARERRRDAHAWGCSRIRPLKAE